MRDPKRIPRILQKLERLWSIPGMDQQRLGQLLFNVSYDIPTDHYQIEDNVWEDLIDKLLERTERKREANELELATVRNS